MKLVSKVVIVAGLLVLVAIAFALRQERKAKAPAAVASGAAVTTGAAVLPKLLDLGSDQCVPCKAMAPILEEIRKEYAGKFDVEFVDVWKNPEVAQKEMVEIIPTQIFRDASGKELYRHTGFLGKEDILAKWQELGVALGR